MIVCVMLPPTAAARSSACPRAPRRRPGPAAPPSAGRSSPPGPPPRAPPPSARPPRGAAAPRPPSPPSPQPSPPSRPPVRRRAGGPRLVAAAPQRVADHREEVLRQHLERGAELPEDARARLHRHRLPVLPHAAPALHRAPGDGGVVGGRPAARFGPSAVWGRRGGVWGRTPSLSNLDA